MAIWQNVDNLYQMKKCVSAILFHCSNIPDPEKRQWYLRTDDSWCSDWNITKSPPSIKDEPEISKLFEGLCDTRLLTKCLHGKTQNANEG